MDSTDSDTAPRAAGGVTGKIQQLVIHLPAASPLVSFEPRIKESPPGRDASTVLMVNECCLLLRKIPDHPEDVAKALIEEGGAGNEFVNYCPAAGCFISGAHQPWLATDLV
jgi:hypothetical protein